MEGGWKPIPQCNANENHPKITKKREETEREREREKKKTSNGL